MVMELVARVVRLYCSFSIRIRLRVLNSENFRKFSAGIIIYSVYTYLYRSKPIAYKTCGVVSIIFLPHSSVPSTHPYIQPYSNFP